MAKKLKRIYRSVIYSLGSCLVITGNGYPQAKRILKHTDAEALNNDWTAIGKDIKKATQTYS